MSDPAPSGADDRRRRNVATTRRLFEAFSAGDTGALVAAVAEDLVYDAPWYDLRREGRAEFAAMLAAVEERFETVLYEVVEVFPLVDPDLVIVEVRSDHAVRGRDRRYRNQYVQFLRFRDGLVVEWREFSNPDAYRAAFAP